MKRVLTALCLAGMVLLGSWFLSWSMPWYLRVGGAVVITYAFFQIQFRVRRILERRERPEKEGEDCPEDPGERKP